MNSLREYIQSLNIWSVDEGGNFPESVEAQIGLFHGYIEKEYHTMKGETQSEFTWKEVDHPMIHGFMDLKLYEDHVGYEFKYSGRPEIYSWFQIKDQLGVYFLGNQDLERITLRVLRSPDLRRKKEESLGDYSARIHQDFLNRPRHYVLDTSYWRNEFPLDEIKEKYRIIAREIVSLLDNPIKDRFYQNNSPWSCTDCEYLGICQTDVISETLYKRREK